MRLVEFRLDLLDRVVGNLSVRHGFFDEERVGGVEVVMQAQRFRLAPLDDDAAPDVRLPP